MYLSGLDEQDRKILDLLTQNARYTYSELGQKLGISKERVRQIERQAMDKLQKSGQSLGLEDFLNE